jgi:holo-[acyl-carrier protein] synthase
VALAGVGVDIVEIARMEKILARTPRFARRVFTDEEREYCERSARPAAHYACRFAAREATLKALGCGFGKGVSYSDVSVAADASGRPQVVLSGRVAELAQEKGVLSVAISLSFTRDMAVANAVATTAETAPKQDETRDPRRELAESFREARSIIDELERVSDGK